MRKTRKFILLVIILVGLGVLISSVYYLGRKGLRGSRIESRNLLLNSRFEMVDRSGRPEFWKMGRQAGWSVSTKAPYEGERSMQATKGWSWLFQDVPIRPERHYLLRAYIKSDIIIPQKVNYENTFLTWECLDWKGKVIKRDYGIVNAISSWQLHEKKILAPGGTEKVRIKLAKRQGKGSVWFDDVELTRSSVTWKFLTRIGQDMPFFIFYFAVYFILLVSLLRIVLKRGPNKEGKERNIKKKE